MSLIYERVWKLPPIKRMIWAHRIANIYKRSANKKFMEFVSGLGGKILTMSTCYLCKKCKKKLNLPCSNPKKRFTPPESYGCLLYTSPSPRDLSTSRMPSSA